MTNWADLKKNLSSIRWQITLRSWLVLIPCFAISNIIIYKVGIATIERNLKMRLQVNSELLNFSIQQWHRNSEDLLEFVSKSNRIRKAAATLNGSYSSTLFRDLTLISKYKLWVLRSRNGKVVDYTGNIKYYDTNTLELKDLKKGRIQNKKNKLDFNFTRSAFQGISCIKNTVPVHSGFNKNDIIGSVGYCLDEKLFSADSGLDTLFQTLNSQSIEPLFTEPSLQGKIFRGLFNIKSTKLTHISEFVIISKAGHLIIPDTKGWLFTRIKTSSPSIKNAQSIGLKDLIDFGLGPDRRFIKIKIHGREFYAYNSSIDGIWESITLVDLNVFTQGFKFIIFQIIILQIFTMIVIGFCLNLQARQISEPIDLARLNIKKISNGIFDINIAHNRHDEIGELYNDINLTAGQLREFIKKITANAITKKQLDIATKIQQDFLVDDLPQSDFYELAAIFDPAYEIGADWYDAVSMNGKIYFIIADVCDKGIASALFMSVFRTLIRYTLLKYHSVSKATCDEILSDVISSVNHYMAITHESSMMFATVFVASYSYKNNSLSYVCAGHELPIIIRSEGLEILKSTGPAIGLFPEAKFEVNQIKFYPGDIIFAYTDGLTDARSPTDTSWGVKNLKDAINAETNNSCSAKELLTNIVSEVTKHIDTAEQFDDLTILVLKAKDCK